MPKFDPVESQRVKMGAHRLSTQGISLEGSESLLSGQVPTRGNDRVRATTASGPLALSMRLPAQEQKDFRRWNFKEALPVSNCQSRYSRR
jgi:hypothetical protein